MFNSLFIFGFNTKDNEIINAGIVIIKAAANSLLGLSTILCPEISPLTVPGTYNLK